MWRPLLVTDRNFKDILCSTKRLVSKNVGKIHNYNCYFQNEEVSSIIRNSYTTLDVCCDENFSLTNDRFFGVGRRISLRSKVK